MTKLPSVMWAPLLLLLLLLLPALSAADCTCDTDNLTPDSKTTTLNYKLAAVAAILTAGAVGVSLPLLGRSTLHVLRPENDIFFMVKAFAAGVILSTGFIHILPDAFDSLTSPCLGGADTVWRRFPFAGMTAMVAAIGSLMADSMATAYYRRVHFGKDKKAATAAAVAAEEEGEHEGHVHVHTHATHGHAHGAAVLVVEEEGVEHVREMGRLEVIRHRVTAQVLELGVVVHSVIIGISLGTAGSLDTIKPLMAALCFHQFFEGMGLGGCISQAKFESRAMATMALFFSVTTPVGVGIGIGISGVYNETSPTSLLIQGFFEAAAAGILIYMALVDLLASDFMSPRLQANLPLQLGANISLILGAGCMTVLAKWA